jgi:hypothetical protein
VNSKKKEWLTEKKEEGEGEEEGRQQARMGLLVSQRLAGFDQARNRDLDGVIAKQNRYGYRPL